MIQKKAVIGAAVFFLAAALLVGGFALAAEAGGKDNPLVTLDYLITLNPQIDAAIEAAANEKISALMAGFDAKLAQASERIEELMAGDGIGGPNISELLDNEDFINRVAAGIASQIGGAAPGGDGIPGEFSRVDFSAAALAGKTTVHIPMGTRIMQRVGTVTVVASSSPGLIDMTDGGILDNGGTLKSNHEYTVTMEAGRDIKCSSNAIVFIWGPYTVS